LKIVDEKNNWIFSLKFQQDDLFVLVWESKRGLQVMIP